jgi:glycosyltransferase involved in cell wall biosynthesis
MRILKIAVILPAFNETLTIQPVIEAFHQALPEALIVVIDNASTDDTYAKAKATVDRLGCEARVIQEHAKGKANAVRRAFLEVDADVYLMVDADMTYPADQARELLQPVLEGRCDMAVGDRISGGQYSQENKRPAHEFGNQLVLGLINRLFRSSLKDVLSGYRAMNRRFVKTYPILVGGFELETDLTLFAMEGRFRVLEIPVRYQDRPEGSVSKLNTVKDGVRVINAIVQIARHHRPMRFFGALGLALLLLGLAAGYPAVNDYVQYRYVYRVPLALLAVGLELGAMLSFATGLVLSTIVRGQKAEQERALLAYVTRRDG